MLPWQLVLLHSILPLLLGIIAIDTNYLKLAAYLV